MIKKLANSNLTLFVASFLMSLVGSRIIIDQTKAYLQYNDHMKVILLVSSVVTTFSLFKIFFARYNKLYKYLFFIGYCGFIYVFLFCRGGDLGSESKFNFEFFAYHELDPDYPQAFKLSIFNILLFLPFGCINYKTRTFNFLSIILFVIMSILIELLQVAERVGVFDVTDILLYFIGFSIGRIIRNIYLRMKLKY